MKKAAEILLLAGMIMLMALLPALTFAEGSTWFCPNCGQENRWNFCSNCGTKKPDTLLCPSCGARWKSELGYVFCPDCGARLALVSSDAEVTHTAFPIPATATTPAPRPAAVATAAPVTITAAPRPASAATAAALPTIAPLQSKTFTISGLNAQTAEAIFQAGLAGAETITIELSSSEWAAFSGNTVESFMGAAGLRGTYYTYSSTKSVTFGRDEDAFYPGLRILSTVRTETEDHLPVRYQQTLAAARNLISGVSGTALEQYAEIHDRLARKIVYTIDENTDEDDCAIGALITGKANCDGYADACLLCCGLKGLDVRYLHGYSREKTGLPGEEDAHLWNLIRLNGTWRGADVTWDDQEEQGILYEYFNLGLDRLRLSYVMNEAFLPSPAEAVTSLTERPVPEYTANTEADITSVITGASQSRINRYVLRCSDSLFAAYLTDSSTFWRAFTRAGGEDCQVIYREAMKTITVSNPSFFQKWAYCETEEQIVSALQTRPSSMMIACSDALFRSYQQDSGVFWRAFARAGGDSAETSYSVESRKIQFSGATWYSDWAWCATADDITAQVSARKSRTTQSFTLVLEKSLYQRLLSSDDHTNLVFLMACGGLNRPLYSYGSSSCVVTLKSYEWYSAWIASVQTQSAMTDTIREGREKGWNTIDLWLSADLYNLLSADENLLVSTIRNAGVKSSISWTSWEGYHRIIVTIE